MVATVSSALALAVVAGPAHAGTQRTWTVEPGTGTISAAVALASPGDTLQLEEGTFRDSVAITFSLTIRGAGEDKTAIVPPSNPSSSCDQGAAVEGLCAAGAFLSGGIPDTSRPVTDVTITDLRVRGFSDAGVFGINTRHLVVRDVDADGNGRDGIMSSQSTDSVFAGNEASGNGQGGLYITDSPRAHAIIDGNLAVRNGTGYLLQDSTDITATGNAAQGNCMGMFAFNTGGGAAGDLPAGNFKLLGNGSSDNDAVCPASKQHPQVSGIGILLGGVHDTVVAGNKVHDNRPGAASVVSGGIAIITSKSSDGGTDPTDNTIWHNTLYRNEPADIVSDGTGTGNVIAGNTCVTSLPPHLGFCSRPG